MIARLGRYVRGSYPPAFYLPYALAWSLGMTALFAVADPRIPHWHLGGGAALAALTFAVDLLLMRAVDDVRDLDYDRTHNPARPLPSGAVRVSDLVVLIAVGTVLVLALNAGRGLAAVVLAAQLGYAFLLVIVDRVWHWPSGDDLVLSAWVNLPVQLLLNLYLYAGVLHEARLRPSWHAVLPLLVAVTAFLHLEYGRKVTRRPRPGERTYVALYGPTGTAVIAVVSATVSAALALVLVRPWAAGNPGAGWAWLVLAPLVFLAFGGYRFWRVRTTTWPLLAAGLFLLTSFLAYLVVGLVGKDIT